ncbi:response regulator transcription factor [Phenylobacterium sp.]|uniref:response regulator transcription factor n=1 Tax=Phenylobacterium sp. TaxID=1871053 RepID=UPI0035682750
MDGVEVQIIDDDPAVRTILGAMLQSVGIATRSYASATAFLAVARDIGPGCIVTDIQMPHIDGFELVRRLVRMGVTRPIIVIAGRGGIPNAVRAMKAGARDFLEKPLRRDALIEAVREAIEADAHPPAAEPASADPIVVDQPVVNKVDALISALSAQEQLVFRGVVAGRPNKTMAYELGISPRTIEGYRAKMMVKVGARNVSDLVRLAYRAGL